MITNNFFSVSQEFMSPDIVQIMSELIHEDKEKTKNGLMAIIPALLSGIVNRGTTKEGAGILLDLGNAHTFELGIKPDESNLKEGSKIVQSVFGDELNDVVSNLKTITGLNSYNIRKLLELAAPLFMAVIEFKVKSEKLNSLGLMNFLNNEKKEVDSFSSAPSEYFKLAGNPSQDISWSKIAIASLVLTGLLLWWLSAQYKITLFNRYHQ